MVPPPVPTTEAESGDPELKTAVDLEEEEIESDEYDSNFGEEEEEEEDEEEADEDADDEGDEGGLTHLLLGNPGALGHSEETDGEGEDEQDEGFKPKSGHEPADDVTDKGDEDEDEEAVVAGSKRGREHEANVENETQLSNNGKRTKT